MKILVLQLKRIGDLIVTAPALAALRRAHPEPRITLVSDRSTCDLLPAFQMADRTFTYGRSGGNGELWRHLAFERYDLCFDYTGNDRSALFSLLSKAPRRVAFNWAKKSRVRSVVYNMWVDSAVRDHHTIDHYLHMVSAEVSQQEQAPLPLQIPSPVHAAARALVDVDDFAILHPGTARPEKYWVPQRWAEVMAFVENELGLPVYITGSPDVYEQAHLAEIRHSATTPWRDLTGKIDLLTLMSLAEKARLFLSVDSAPMHMAAMFGTPQVALFGPTNPFHWRPRHPRARVIMPTGLATSFTPRHPKGQLVDISTEMVIDVARQLHSP